ncbi:Uncharacterised protein [Acinetobacter nosocomialis]|uniref:hypothetical protein n=1 Tax=Acinetobacter nosocomialis TaxID=106654 RepID=UPI000DE6679C|nr:hypothetical protein [Acinetobacter nosocomialis]SSO21322.1 Uncharacterised protein [Acinetobacter nosocomialis]SSQ80048.1 Uncharacterised protein [Acinetobacter nosocomialis]
MDSKWIEQQRREMEKLISPDLIKSREEARKSYFDHMEKEMARHVSRSIEPLSGKKQNALVELRGAIEKLAQKYKQDAHALTLLGDLEKSRVYNGIANQLDHLLKGGA